jgi:hypothetical protein
MHCFEDGCLLGCCVVCLLLGAANISETSANIYHTTRRSILEDSYLHTRRSENLKSCPKHIMPKLRKDSLF